MNDENLYSDLMKTIRGKTGLKSKALFMPVRAAITGKISGPELEKIFSILGKESILKRLKNAIQITGIDITDPN